MAFQLLLPARFLSEMVAQARAELPNECCGLLAGRVAEGVGRVEVRYPLVNVAASPVEYLSNDRELFKAHRDIRARGFELLAVYHSHPTSDPVPSRKDLERNYQGDTTVHFIISLRTGEAVVRAWRLGEAAFQEVTWEVEGAG
jgi:proteasome lid subunit RPN8/RPN11